MNKSNRALLEKVNEMNLEAALNEEDVTKKAALTKVALDGVDRSLEMDKETTSKWMKLVEIIIPMAVGVGTIFLENKLRNRSNHEFLKELCAFEREDSLTTTGGKVLANNIFNFGGPKRK